MGVEKFRSIVFVSGVRSLLVGRGMHFPGSANEECKSLISSLSLSIAKITALYLNRHKYPLIYEMNHSVTLDNLQNHMYSLMQR